MRWRTACEPWIPFNLASYRMADFALWATACETALWPAGTFSHAYATNRKAAIEAIIDADPIAAWVRELMSERSSWTGSAADLLQVSGERSSQTGHSSGRLQNPRALAGHLRRAQTFLRAIGIDVTFSREGRAGTRVIRIRRSVENNVSTVSSVSRVRDCGFELPSEEHCLVRSSAGPDHSHPHEFAPDPGG